MSVDIGALFAAADWSVASTHALPLGDSVIQIESLAPIATLTARTGDHVSPIYRCSDSDALQALSARFIREQYWTAHKATLNSLMCQRYAILDDCGGPCAVVGVKTIEDRSTLVERYLDDPIETVVSRAAGQIVKREQLIEVGNLAANSLIQSARLIVFLLHWLKQAGVSYAVCTGTEAVRLALKRARVPFDVVGTADPSRLGNERWAWGSYYQKTPKILLIAIDDGLAAVGERYRFYGAV